MARNPALCTTCVCRLARSVFGLGRRESTRACSRAPQGEEGHRDLLNSAYSMFDVSNPLHGSTFPSVVKFEAEVPAPALPLSLRPRPAVTAN